MKAILGGVLLFLMFFAGRMSMPRYELRTMKADGIGDQSASVLVRVDVQKGTMCYIGTRNLTHEDGFSINGRFISACGGTQ